MYGISKAKIKLFNQNLIIFLEYSHATLKLYLEQNIVLKIDKI
ncbi:hypothetical protein [Campylobacter sp. 2018MI34]|nr:hypothetical protein [Campylobacter sp. 2018MI34]